MSYIERAQAWTDDFFDNDTVNEVLKMKQNPELLEDCFYRDLEFGTGGMRGVMGVGTNRINEYTLGKNTQGLANYLKELYPTKELKVAIAYDCRNNSNTLAQTVANVLSANGIIAYLYPELRTTPALSFSVKELNCQAGIVLTASHNPPEYNGYKVYWADGGQIVPPQDQEIVNHINAIDFKDINFNANASLIKLLGKDTDEAFFNASVANGDFKAPNKENLNIVFTPLHGTSITAIPEVLKRAGYENVHIVESQRVPDGNFPTVKSPNPEEPEALKLALELADEVHADIVIGTDPDSDRLGIAVRDQSGKLILLNGNQTMVLMIDFLLQERQKKGFKKGDYIASTIVSTPMMKVIADAYEVGYIETLTGFKWIADAIKNREQQYFIGGGEESYGFMVGDFVRDKDAVTSTLLACEIATYAKSEGISMYQRLLELYKDHGCYKEHLISLVKKGKKGAEEIAQMMVDLRQQPPQNIGGEKVIKVADYQESILKDLRDNSETTIDLPKSNVLIFHTEKGSMIAARPSGTEPKIKFYISVNASLATTDDYLSTSQKLQERIDAIAKDFNN